MQKKNTSLSEFYDKWQKRIKQYKVIIKCLEDYFNSDLHPDGKPSPKELLQAFKNNPQYSEHCIMAKGPNDEKINFKVRSHANGNIENQSIETLDINVFTHDLNFLFQIKIHWDNNDNFYVWDFDFDRLDAISWSKFHNYLTCLFYNDYDKSEDDE